MTGIVYDNDGRDQSPDDLSGPFALSPRQFCVEQENTGVGMRMRFSRAVVAAAVSLCAFAGQTARADDYPARPVTLVHGFGAGGNADAIARIVGEGLSRRLGKPGVIQARTGAGGNIASDHVAKATPDGYTLIMLTGGHATSAALSKSLPFDPVGDFQM